MNTFKLMNTAAVRKAALDKAKASRGQRFTRVSETFLNRIHNAIHKAIEQEVASHPSVGKTLK